MGWRGDGGYPTRPWHFAPGPYVVFAGVSGGVRPGWAMQRGVCAPASLPLDRSLTTGSGHATGPPRTVELALSEPRLVELHGRWTGDPELAQSVGVRGAVDLLPEGPERSNRFRHLPAVFDAEAHAGGFSAWVVEPLAEPPLEVAACTHPTPPEHYIYGDTVGRGGSRSCDLYRGLQGTSWDFGELPPFEQVTVVRADDGLRVTLPWELRGGKATIGVSGRTSRVLLTLVTRARSTVLPYTLVGRSVDVDALKVHVFATEGDPRRRDVWDEDHTPVRIHRWYGPSGVTYD